MPKMKTHKGLKKRVRVTGSGKVMRPKCNGSHLMSGTPAGKRRAIGKNAEIAGLVARKIKILLNK